MKGLSSQSAQSTWKSVLYALLTHLLSGLTVPSQMLTLHDAKLHPHMWPSRPNSPAATTLSDFSLQLHLCTVASLGCPDSGDQLHPIYGCDIPSNIGPSIEFLEVPMNDAVAYYT